MLIGGGALGITLLAVNAVRIHATISGSIAVGDDFTSYWNGARSVADGHSPYEWLAENRPYATPNADYFYPPLLALLLAPFTRLLDYPAARWSWLFLGVVCLAGGVGLTWRASDLHLRGRRLLALVPCIGVLPSVVVALGIGQLSPILLLVVAAGYAAIRAGRPVLLGAAVAVAAGLKGFPALLGLYLVLGRRYQACVSTALLALLELAASVAVLGWEPHREYLTAVVATLHYWYGMPSNVSIVGFFTRLLSDNAFTTPVVSAEALAAGLTALCAAGILGASAYAVWRARAARQSRSRAYAMVVVASLLLSPINGHYNLMIALVGLVAAAAYVQATWPGHLRWLLWVGLLLSLPVEYCDLGPEQWCQSYFPLVPLAALPWRYGWGNLLSCGPLVGLILLWALLVRSCLEPSAATVPAIDSEASTGQTLGGFSTTGDLPV